MLLVSKKVNLTVWDQNQPPTLNQINDETVNENEELEIIVSANDPENDTLEFTADLGAIAFLGATFTGNTLKWKVPFNAVVHPDTTKDYQVTINVSDKSGGEDSQTVTITVNDVNQEPQIARLDDTAIDEGVTLRIILNVRDGDKDTPTFSVTPTLNGAGFNGNVYTWPVPFNRVNPPETQEIIQFTFTADDGFGGTAQEVTTIIVRDVNANPVVSISPSIVQPVAEGSAVPEISVSATDSDGDTITISGYLGEAGKLGATFVNGKFNWTPPLNSVNSPLVAQDFKITFTAFDSRGGAGTADVVITVIDRDSSADGNNPPAIALTPVKYAYTIDEGDTVSFTASASDLDTGDTVELSAIALPQHLGATFNQNTGLFEWTPPYTTVEKPAVGNSYTVTLLAKDNHGDIDTEVVIITVSDVNPPPTLFPIGDKIIKEGKALSFKLFASDPDGDAFTFSMSGDTLPGTPTLDAITGDFTWTPPYSTVVSPATTKDFVVTFKVSDANRSSSETITITVLDANQPPELPADVSNKVANEGTTLTIDVGAATDPENDTLSFSADLGSTKNNGATFNTSTGVFEWNIPYTVVNAPAVSINFDVTFTVRDSHNNSDTETITITVNDVTAAPALSPVGNQTAKEGIELKIDLSITNPDIHVLTYTATGTLMSMGATINASTGLFKWTPPFNAVTAPNQTQDYSVTLGVSDTRGADSETITITVENTNRRPILDPVIDRGVYEGDLLSIPVSAQDPDTGDTITISATLGDTQALGATFTNNTFAWTPPNNTVTPAEKQKDFTVAFTATDDYTATDSKTITITVVHVNVPPVLNAIGNKNVNEDTLLEITLSATDDDSDSLTYSTTPFFGATITGNVFRVTPPFNAVNPPDTSKDYAVTITVDDGNGGKDSETITITVQNGNVPPVLAPIGNKTVKEMETLRITAHATDNDADALSYSADLSQIPGATFGNQVLEWKPSYTMVTPAEVTKDFTVIITVSDGNGGSDSETITITVEHVNAPPILTPIGLQTVTKGQTLTINVSATDVDNDTLEYSANLGDTGSLGATFTGNTLQWTPPDHTVTAPTKYKIYQVSFSVSDGKLTNSQPVTIKVVNVNSPPVLTVGDKSVTEGTTLVIVPTAIDADNDTLTFSANLGAAGTAGATFNPNIPELRWTPAYNTVTLAEGSKDFTVTLTADDGNGGTDTDDVTIKVSNGNPVPTLASIGDKTIAEGQLLQIQLSANDPENDTLTFSAAGKPMQLGATINANTGLFEWTPSADVVNEQVAVGQSFTITFAVDDGRGGSDSETITITVTNTNLPPTMTKIGNKTISEGERLTITISATDPEGDTLTFSAPLGNIATLGATFVGQTFDWMPPSNAVTLAEKTKDFMVTFTVDDGNGNTDGELVIITVLDVIPPDVNLPPVLDTIGKRSIYEGETVTITLSASDPNNDQLTYHALAFSTGPTKTGATFNPQTRTLTWTPPENLIRPPLVGQSYTYMFLVFDGRGGSDNERVDIQVLDSSLHPAPSGELIPPKSALWQNYPNPFNPDTWLPFWLAKDASVTLKIYNCKSKAVRTINLGTKKAGVYISKDRAVYWDGKTDAGEEVVSGVYFYTIRAGKFVATRKMIVVR